MKEKLKEIFKGDKVKGFLNSEKVKGFSKKVFSKKVIGTAIVAIVLIIALRISFCLMFQVEGNVTKVDGKNVVVANFFYTKTVDLGELKTDNIQVGERIRITKNLSGDVISVQGGHGRPDGGERGIGRRHGGQMGLRRPGGEKGPGQNKFGGKQVHGN